MKKKWKSWLLLAAPYLLSALMPVISVLFLGNTIVTDYQDKLIADRQNSLETAFERMIQKTETVEELSVVLSASDTLEQYSYACLNHSGHDPLSFMAVRDLFAGAMVNPVIYDIYLFDSKDNTVISASSAASASMEQGGVSRITQSYICRAPWSRSRTLLRLNRSAVSARIPEAPPIT